MSALLPLLAVVVATASAAATAAPALLVLRAACALDPSVARTAFSPERIQRYATAHPATAAAVDVRRPPLHLLPYNETCGPEWQTSVSRATLSALSGGGSVACAGSPGSRTCSALAGAAVALRRATPAACGPAAARAAGAAVRELATRLRWRRARLPRAAPSSQCEAVLREVARGLAAAGLVVQRESTLRDEDAARPHVVVLCASKRSGGGRAVQLLPGASGTSVPLFLLLRVDEIDRSPIYPAQDAYRSNNITLVIENYIYSHAEDNVTPLLPFRRKRLPGRFKARTFIERQATSRTSSEFKIGGGTIHSSEHPNRRTRIPRDSQQRPGFDDMDALLSHFGDGIPERYLLLGNAALDRDEVKVDVEAVYDEVLADLDVQLEAERTRTEFVQVNYHLYEGKWSEARTATSWSRIASLVTTSRRSLDWSLEWVTTVTVSESGGLRQWSAARESAGATALVSVMGGGAGLALMIAGGVVARWAARRRRGRRRRGDAVLVASDFTFPADERRCVGEGMETMLSCWLQQLHEFGGPELERPDLLKQPSLAPSAPSSTCSVNRLALDRRTRFKGDAVQIKYLPVTGALELKRKATDVLLVMQSLRHENLNPFIGCLWEARPALVFDYCGRGSLEDVLMADDIKLDWTFRLSLLTDLVKGMRYLHATPLRVHGRLSSRNCVVDSRWVLRVTDYGMLALAHSLPAPTPVRTARDLLWTAPEVLRDMRAGGEGGGSQAGDVFSFAIIMQEVIVRGEPYCMLSLTPEEIVEKLQRPPPLIRPSVSIGAAPPEAVSVMRQCWSEPPDLRPDFHRLHDIFRHLHRGRKINIVDSMFEMLEKYSNNLEELIKERTEQLDMEKKKTEQLLNRMLPRSVAERLLLGSRVEPEEFEEVSIYFSDIVGFTSLAARSTPVQVVDLLNDLYTTFDAAIEQYRVYKVETIGDAYMVVGGLPVRARDHAESVATMALHLLHLAGCFRVRHLPDTPLHLRIGLHSGPCCAGVVGLTMPRYCLFGDTVNTASRMESTGAAWRVQVSAATAARLAAASTAYRLRSRGLTQIKGKGAMHTYWLLGKDGFDKPLPTPPPLPSEEVLYETDGENEIESEPTLAQGERPRAAIASLHADHSHISTGTTASDKQAWQRSGAVSADCSPPASREPPQPPSARADLVTPYTRYRCLSGGGAARSLRRQWSLERGEALAAAAAAAPVSAAAAARTLEPLALALCPPPPRTAPRYRTRPPASDDPPAPTTTPP